MRVLRWPGYEEKDVIQEFGDTHGVKAEFKIYIGGEQMLQFFSRSRFGWALVQSIYIAVTAKRVRCCLLLSAGDGDRILHP